MNHLLKLAILIEIFDFEIWDLIALMPDHCLSVYFVTLVYTFRAIDNFLRVLCKSVCCFYHVSNELNVFFVFFSFSTEILWEKSLP